MSNLNFKPMFKKKYAGVFLQCAQPIELSRVKQKINDESVDKVLVRDFSRNFSEFPRDMSSENFSLDAQLQSGITLKEVNSVVFHDNEITPELEQKISELVNEDVEPINE